jgi:hypothetical protein
VGLAAGGFCRGVIKRVLSLGSFIMAGLFLVGGYGECFFLGWRRWGAVLLRLVQGGERRGFVDMRLGRVFEMVSVVVLGGFCYAWD